MESKKWFVQTPESCVDQLSSDFVHGLSSAEAQQRQEQSGHNEWQ